MTVFNVRSFAPIWGRGRVDSLDLITVKATVTSRFQLEMFENILRGLNWDSRRFPDGMSRSKCLGVIPSHPHHHPEQARCKDAQV